MMILVGTKKGCSSVKWRTTLKVPEISTLVTAADTCTVVRCPTVFFRSRKVIYYIVVGGDHIEGERWLRTLLQPGLMFLIQFVCKMYLLYIW